MDGRGNSVEAAENEIRERLIERLEEEVNLPFLFVGSGLSRRYMGIPTWENLLRQLAEDSGVNFDLIRSNHAEDELPEVASELYTYYNREFHTQERYAQLKKKYQSISGSFGASLKIGISEIFSSHKLPELEGEEAELSYPYLDELCILKDIKTDGIITTNYDRLVETVFPDFETFVGQNQMLLNDARSIGDIYKIHGSIDDPMSIVITQEDYEAADSKNVYLAAKLLTIFAERPIVFLGYSLGDKYIQKMLESIAGAAGEYKLDVLSRRLIFVEWNDQPGTLPEMIENSRQVGDTYIPTTLVRSNSFKFIYEALATIDSKLPPAVIKKMYNQVYEVISTARENGKVKQFSVVPLEDLPDDEGRAIVGLGLGELNSASISSINEGLPSVGQVGIRGVMRENLIEDVLQICPLDFAAEDLLQVYSGIASNVYVPVWKYLRESGRMEEEVNYDGLSKRVRTFANRDISISQHSRSRFNQYFSGGEPTMRDIMEDDGLKSNTKCDFIVLLDASSYELDELNDAATAILDLESRKCTTGVGKLAVLYDRLRYGLA